MTHFTFPAASLISAVEVGRTPRPARSRAPIAFEGYLTANAEAKEGELAKVTSFLESKGLVCEANAIDGKHVLHVKGLKNESELLSILKEGGLISGEPQPATSFQTMIKERTPKKVDKALSHAGITYLIADAILFVNGLLRASVVLEPKQRSKGYSEAMTGLAWAAGGVVDAVFGHRDPEKQLQDTYRHLYDYLELNGVEIPKGSQLTQANLTRRGGLVEKALDFMKDYPSEILNATFVIGGKDLIQAGLQQKVLVHNKSTNEWVNKPNYFKSAAGAFVIGGGLTGLLLQEHSKTEEKQTQGDIEHPVKKKPGHNPLWWSGVLYSMNNISIGIGAVLERFRVKDRMKYLEGLSNDALTPALKTELTELSKGKHFYLLNLAAVAAYLVANTFLRHSTRAGDVSEHAGEEFEALYKVSAHFISQQPLELQDQVIKMTAAKLSKERAIHIPKEVLEKQIREHVEALANSPWVSHRHLVSSSRETSAGISL